jgi:hypothetical protein
VAADELVARAGLSGAGAGDERALVLEGQRRVRARQGSEGRCVLRLLRGRRGQHELHNEATTVVLMREGHRTVLSMQNDYRGPVEDFALVVPVPVVAPARRRAHARSRDLRRGSSA